MSKPWVVQMKSAAEAEDGVSMARLCAIPSTADIGHIRASDYRAGSLKSKWPSHIAIWHPVAQSAGSSIAAASKADWIHCAEHATCAISHCIQAMKNISGKNWMCPVLQQLNQDAYTVVILAERAAADAGVPLKYNMEHLAELFREAFRTLNMSRDENLATTKKVVLVSVVNSLLKVLFRVCTLPA